MEIHIKYMGQLILELSQDEKFRVIEKRWYEYVPCKEYLTDSQTGNFEKRTRYRQRKINFLGLTFWYTLQKISVTINADYFAFILGCTLGGNFERPEGTKTIDELFYEKGFKSLA